MPIWVRKFIVDFIESGFGAVVAVQFVLPSTTDEALKLAAIFGTAIAGALASAIRRAFPDFLVWFKAKLGTT